MKKKTKKEAKKPRPKTVTLKQWRIKENGSSCIFGAVYRTKADALNAVAGRSWVYPVHVTITYEVRR